MELDGKISITRDSKGSITIAIEDETSGVRFLEVSLTPETLGLAITGLSALPCKLNIRGLQNVGKRREMKHEVIEFTERNPPASVVLFQALKLETDGWVCDWNPKQERINFTDKAMTRASVRFTRYVDIGC